MEAVATTIPNPARRGRFTKIAAVAIAVAALALAIAGAVSLAANAWRDDSGYFNWPKKSVHQQQLRDHDEDRRRFPRASVGVQ
jgi:TRAP-type C4-dicarboxylate transport system permease small subunit